MSDPLQRWAPVLRPGGPADARCIAALAIQVFLDTYATDGVRADLADEAFADYGVAAFAARLVLPGRRFVLAEVASPVPLAEGQGPVEPGLAGFAELQGPRVPAPLSGVEGAELVRLYVQPQAQRLGLGRQLLQAAEGRAAEAGAEALWLTAWSGNTRARAFYAAQGYDDVGETSIEIQGRTYVNRVLRRTLPPCPERPATPPR